VTITDSFGVFDRFNGYDYIDLRRLPDQGAIARLPVWRRILLEGLLRNLGRSGVTHEHIRDAMQPVGGAPFETIFTPARIVMQDYSGTPVLVDLAALRSALSEKGLNPALASPSIPVDLVVDHSLILEHTGHGALARNLKAELAANAERYDFLQWAAANVANVTVAPPGQGIIHQLNMERFSQPVIVRDSWLMPDTVIGTDSHTTMINGLGILGWGVGGIEATAAMMGMPPSMQCPRSVCLRLTGKKGLTVQAADIALTLTERLRAHGVVGSVIEVHGPGVAALSVEDRATVANMCPEYGATACLFPMDETVFDYMTRQDRPAELIAAARRYAARNGFLADVGGETQFDDWIDFDISTCGLTVAGPSRPDQRHNLSDIGTAFRESLPESRETGGSLKDGDLVLAAITSCTNTANSGAMIAAGLLARAAREKGLAVRKDIKCTMALGSVRAAETLRRLGLLEDLEALGFHVDGFGCGACVGNVGRLSPDVEAELGHSKVIVAAALSGNRNFPGRIHSNIQANFLSSPAAVVALALAGNVRSDPFEAILIGPGDRAPVSLVDLWPSNEEVAAQNALLRVQLTDQATEVERWADLQAPPRATYNWDAHSDYLIRPPFFDLPVPAMLEPLLRNAAPLLMLGDAITTDHISPVGAISPASDSGRYLTQSGVQTKDFNTYGARRGNHEVMLRGTFANPRLQNLLVDLSGPWTQLSGSSEPLSIYDAAMQTQNEGRQTVVLAGKSYGAGSARDWAAKGTRLLGVRAVLAESFERIHRANLVCMGVVPIQIASVLDLPCSPELRLSAALEWAEIQPSRDVEIEWTCPKDGGGMIKAKLRIDTANEADIIRRGGLLPTVLQRFV